MSVLNQKKSGIFLGVTRKFAGDLVFQGIRWTGLARSASSCLGLKDKKSGLETLAIKQSLLNLGTALRWRHSFAQLADCMTKNDSKSREPLELFQGRKYRWKMVTDPSFTAAKKGAELGLDVLDSVPTEEIETEMTIPADPRALKFRQYRSQLHE